VHGTPRLGMRSLGIYVDIRAKLIANEGCAR
jgi:hypothetical protein